MNAVLLRCGDPDVLDVVRLLLPFHAMSLSLLPRLVHDVRHKDLHGSATHGDLGDVLLWRPVVVRRGVLMSIMNKLMISKNKTIQYYTIRTVIYSI